MERLGNALHNRSWFARLELKKGYLKGDNGK
jgi:hypothetical protein